MELKYFSMELTEEEREFLIYHLQGDLTWTTYMKRDYPGFDKRYDNLLSILTKLGSHPLKKVIEKNVVEN
jgi:GTP cyclohydrolase III